MSGSAIALTAARRRRIGVDFHTFDGIFQGSRSHVLGLFREAVLLAPELDFVFFLENTQGLLAGYPEFGSPNVTLVRMPHAPGPVRLAFQLPWLQLRHRLDLLHTQYRIPFVPLGPCACTIHDLLFESHPEFFGKGFVLQSKATFRYSAWRSRLLFSVSEFSRGELAKRYGADAKRIGVLYNGVDARRFHPGPDGADRLAEYGLATGSYILTVGRLEPRKNHRRLVEAYAALGPDVPPLVCVGQRDFGYEAALSAARSFGVADRVRFLENIADDMLPILMRHARLFVFPAYAEGFGMPVAEAMASGVPVVTSNTTSLPEVAGDAAVLVDPYDVAAIADGMRAVLGDERRAADMVEKGLRQVLKFDWRQSAQTMVDAYRKHFAAA